MSSVRRGLSVCLVAAALFVAPAYGAAPKWVETWAASPDRAGASLPASTVRQVVRISAGGKLLRIRLSNLLGTRSLNVGAAVAAPSLGGSGVDRAKRVRITFGGSAAVSIPPGMDVVSDPIALPTGALGRVAVSLYLPEGSSSPTQHGVGLETGFIADGDQTELGALIASRTTRNRYLLTDVEAAVPGAATFMVLGDSISDGVGSTFGADSRWPDVLARRIQAAPTLRRIAVANAGISGNRLLNDAAAPFVGPSGIGRFSRDVLAKPGVRWVLLFEGINDIAAGALLKTPQDDVSADQIISGMEALIARAHAAGVAVIGATLLPTGGVGEPFESPAAEAKRQTVNDWIRRGCGFDAVVDLDRRLRDPAAPDRLLPQFDSGDHLHPNDFGHAAIAQAVEATLLAVVRTTGTRRRSPTAPHRIAAPAHACRRTAAAAVG